MTNNRKSKGAADVWRTATRLIALLTIPLLSAVAASPAYDYEVLAQNGDVIDGIPVTLNSNVVPFIADDGAVLFGQGFNGMMCCSAIFSKRLHSPGRVLVQAGDVIEGLTVSVINSASRNDRGEVIFGITYSGPTKGAGIFRKNAKVVLSGDVISGLTLVALQGTPQINDAGEIVFGASYTAPDGTLGQGIFTPHRVLAKTGDVIDGATLIQFYSPFGLSKNGIVAFHALYADSLNQLHDGMFTPDHLVASNSSPFGGVQLAGPVLGNAAITELGVIGFGSEYLPLGGGQCCAIAFFLGDLMIAKTGDILDGFTLSVFDPVAPILGLRLNATGEGLFQSLAVTPEGGLTAGWFTQYHSVVVSGDSLAGFYSRQWL